MRLRLGRRLVNLLPLAERTKTLTKSESRESKRGTSIVVSVEHELCWWWWCSVLRGKNEAQTLLFYVLVFHDHNFKFSLRAKKRGFYPSTPCFFPGDFFSPLIIMKLENDFGIFSGFFRYPSKNEFQYFSSIFRYPSKNNFGITDNPAGCMSLAIRYLLCIQNTGTM